MMQVEELYDLTTWITSSIVEEEIVQKYQELHKVLKQNAQPNQEKQPFEEQQKALIKAINAVPLSELSVGQIELLNELGIAQNVGREGVALIEDVLFKNAVDIANAAERINQCITELNEGIQWAQQERELLAKIVTSDGITPIEDQVLLRVHFAGEASIENLSELKEWSKIWWEIGRGMVIPPKNNAIQKWNFLPLIQENIPHEEIPIQRQPDPGDIEASRERRASTRAMPGARHEQREFL